MLGNFPSHEVGKSYRRATQGSQPRLIVRPRPYWKAEHFAYVGALVLAVYEVNLHNPPTPTKSRRVLFWDPHGRARPMRGCGPYEHSAAFASRRDRWALPSSRASR